MKAIAGVALVLAAALIGCEAGDRGSQDQGGGGGGPAPSPSPSKLISGPTGGPGSYGGPGMGGVDVDGIGPPAQGGGGGGGGGDGRYYSGPPASYSEDPNVNPINTPRR